MTTHEFYMQRCLQLASKGLGLTYPNPMVGCVIVCEEKIIGEGWHQKAGKAHAEVNAINSVKDKNLLPKSTLYVSLEPCSHYGKTPPCTDLILKMNIKNVVIGTIDFNSEVHGKGIEHLKNKGCKVSVGILENKCRELNKRFFTFHQKKRPYIILKWAETEDGFIFPEMKAKKSMKPIWISNIYSLQQVHKWRAEEQSILVGTSTAIIDNPKLNAREYFGSNPLRLVIDKDLKIDTNNILFDGELKTIVFTQKTGSNFKNVIYKTIDFSVNVVKQICDYLYDIEIQSVIIEGGSKTLQSFINENLWDEARVFTGDLFFKNGIKAPVLKKRQVNITQVPSPKRQNNKNKLTIFSND
ncbi:MAG: bifunctional diaminohydroxyphosphoribosylaminopyrimidine deaminase/5-amino-6-(5-phosphoribosylamino)uracil reductase RibD [Bacteroidota bacterium]